MNDVDEQLRPQNLDDFGGQPDLVRQLRIVLTSAAKRATLPGHILLSGPPGTGKTTLANIIASEVGADLVVTSGPAIAHSGELVAVLTRPRRPMVLFIDEIHALDRQTEEFLYPAMEDGAVDIATGEDLIRLPLDPFCLVGATTQAGRLTAPLRDRFGYLGKLEPYGTDTLADIAQRTAGILDLDLSRGGAEIIARASRATPRVSNRLVSLVRDWAVSSDVTTVDETTAEEALAAFGYDKAGLDSIAQRLLRILCEDHNGGPLGVDNLAKILDVHVSTIEEEYEPSLIRDQMLLRTSRGRIAGPAAWTHLGLERPADAPTVTPAKRFTPTTSRVRPGPNQTGLGI